MGTKLICKLVFLLFVVVSCTTTKKSSSSNFFIREEDYVKAYKACVLSGCLNEGTKGNFSKFLRDNNDLGLFSEVDLIFHANADIAKSLGQTYSRNIKPFSYGDGKGKIPNFSDCFHYSLSHEIDSIAKESYKQFVIEYKKISTD